MTTPFLLNDPPALACYQRMHAHLSVRNQWRDVYSDSLQMLAAYCGYYLTIVRELRANPNREGRKAVARARKLAKNWLADYGLIESDIRTDDGVDREIRRLCEPASVLVAPDGVGRLGKRLGAS